MGPQDFSRRGGSRLKTAVNAICGNPTALVGRLYSREGLSRAFLKRFGQSMSLRMVIPIVAAAEDLV